MLFISLYHILRCISTFVRPIFMVAGAGRRPCDLRVSLTNATRLLARLRCPKFALHRSVRKFRPQHPLMPHCISHCERSATRPTELRSSDLITRQCVRTFHFHSKTKRTPIGAPSLRRVPQWVSFSLWQVAPI